MLSCLRAPLYLQETKSGLNKANSLGTPTEFSPTAPPLFLRRDWFWSPRRFPLSKLIVEVRRCHETATAPRGSDELRPAAVCTPQLGTEPNIYRAIAIGHKPFRNLSRNPRGRNKTIRNLSTLELCVHCPEKRVRNWDQHYQHILPVGLQK